MYSKVKIAGHPIHPMLVAFPVAFYTSALACYIVYNSNQNPFWFKVAVLANVAGVATALLAAIPGFVDWLYIPSGTRAKKTGMIHLVCNVLALLCFAYTAYLGYPKRNESHAELGLAIPITALGFILTMVAGFMGWALVQKHHIGVDTNGPAPKLPG
jgi:uncharacterized membrane protein